ncbi:hypothetical protein EDI_013280 [Entamoeba dispar SAW760]|uniref:Uncharacterized protein n=1 Tax=Entamoeba dispar (strain ATCC PRA-260 / SAW760) TaxID=370354 RepID=B0ENJ3_ENTDS|nr:uncharacterized protein EDI_013280 [Entamoeba dispar SAW760]EDR23900.1 hypothetical protein EDI_013280 [Entamoeba dispar SAW760]|eukprot:EDR23900.1 hypothetical protein EDI_013280 [Entamoeba dispar SAW760]
MYFVFLYHLFIFFSCYFVFDLIYLFLLISLISVELSLPLLSLYFFFLFLLLLVCHFHYMIVNGLFFLFVFSFNFLSFYFVLRVNNNQYLNKKNITTKLQYISNNSKNYYFILWIYQNYQTLKDDDYNTFVYLLYEYVFYRQINYR